MATNEQLFMQSLLKISVDISRPVAFLKKLLFPPQVDNALRPGQYAHTWTSLSLPTYFRNVTEALKELKLVVKQVSKTMKNAVDIF